MEKLSTDEIPKLKIEDGRIFLDGREVTWLQSYAIKVSAEDLSCGLAELTLTICVDTREFDS